MTHQEREIITKRLQELESEHGRITPRIVVKDAQNKDSPLHAQFEWDTKKAAMSYWLEQARVLLRSVRIVVHDERSSLSVVGYVRDPTAESDQQGYVSISKVRTDADLAREVVVNEFSRAAAAMRRAREIAFALQIEGEIDAIVDRIETVKHSVQQVSV